MAEKSTVERREPPPFRRLNVARMERLGPRMVRMTLSGPELAGFAVGNPASSVRLLIPSRGELVIPQWNGNEFLLADGSRPVIRTFTPRNLAPHGLDLDIVLHRGGVVSGWVETARLGDAVAMSGPGRGYEIDGSASGYLLIGDETAIPAISQLLECIPGAVPVDAHVVVASDFGRVEMPDQPGSAVTWRESPAVEDVGEVMLEILRETGVEEGVLIWCAGEAAAMQVVRSYLFKELSVPRARATVRGYWKAKEIPGVAPR